MVRSFTTALVAALLLVQLALRQRKSFNVTTA